MPDDIEIVNDMYRLINKFYSHLVNTHDRFYSTDELNLIKECKAFELKNGIRLEELLKEKNIIS